MRVSPRVLQGSVQRLRKTKRTWPTEVFLFSVQHLQRRFRYIAALHGQAILGKDVHICKRGIGIRIPRASGMLGAGFAIQIGDYLNLTFSLANMQTLSSCKVSRRRPSQASSTLSALEDYELQLEFLAVAIP